MIELYFAPGACSFVPHVALEIIHERTGTNFEPKLIKLHKGEQATAEYLAINPNAQVPVLVVDGKPLNQIVAICDYLDRRFPQAELLPVDPWARAQAMSALAWMNNSVHPTFTHIFMPDKFTDDKAAQDLLRTYNSALYRKHLERIQASVEAGDPQWHQAQPTVHDAYAFTLLRWGGIAGIDPASLPALKAYIERVMTVEPVAAAIARERVALNTYRPAA